MDTRLIGEVARALGTTTPRITRCIRRLHITPSTTPAGQQINVRDVAMIEQDLGSTPAGWDRTREDGFVLAALNQRPLGVRSLRAVARIATVSPTTAAKVTARLILDGLVSVETVRVVEGGIVDAELFVINRTADQWRTLAPKVRQIILPAPKKSVPAGKVPARLWHHFWNGNPARIRLPADADYVASRLLRVNDPQALAWAAAHLPATAINAVATLRGTTPAERTLLHNLAKVAK